MLEKVFRASGQEPYVQKAKKNAKKVKRGPTDQPNDGQTAGCRVA